MKPWQHIVRIGDIIYSDDLLFETRRDEVVKRLRASSAIRDGEAGMLLAGLVDELADVEDADSYDWVMSEIYDLADINHWLWVGP